jgi:hypothetical protein
VAGRGEANQGDGEAHAHRERVERVLWL